MFVLCFYVCVDQIKRFEYRGFDPKEKIPHGTEDEEFGMPKHWCAICKDWIVGDREWRKHLKVTGHREPETTMRPTSEKITWERAKVPHHGAVMVEKEGGALKRYCSFCEEWKSDEGWLDHINKTGHRTVFPDPKKQ